MLNNALNTNEVKNSAGAEVEFSRLSIDGKQTEFSQVGETPAYQHRLSIKHQELSTGAKARRRSVVRIDKTVSGVDGSPTKVSAYCVIEIPNGNLATYDEPKNVVAELMSFMASTGANTTILYDCSGNGASSLINGSL